MMRKIRISRTGRVAIALSTLALLSKLVGCNSDSIAELRRSAEQGSTYAQVELAIKYHKGNGVKRDYAEALRLYNMAAQTGDAVAQNNIGAMYSNGEGVPQDFAVAVHWYRLAAEQGTSKSQENLGRMYADGTGVARDLITAHMWINLASANAGPEERESIVRFRESLAKKMSPKQLLEAQRLAREWKPKVSIR